jgi:hypothetical protein
MSDDPREESPKVNDLFAKRLLKEEAAELLDPKGVFMAAVKAVRLQWFGDLMDTRDPDATLTLVAQLRALDAIPEQLQTAVNDYKMAQSRQKHA